MHFRPLLPLLLALGLGACSGDAPVDEGFGEIYEQDLERYLGTITPASDTVRPNGDHRYDFDPSSGAVCMRGAPFNVATRTPAGANEGDLVIYLQGGGACWSDLCQAFEEVVVGGEIPPGGLLNRDLAGNPFADWNIAYVPYCDGSLFIGDVEVDEDGDGTPDRIQHGLKNLSAALDVFVQEFPSPERIVLAGSSAGSYGTILALPLVRAVYPDARIQVIQDAGLGIGLGPDEPDFVNDILAEWNALQYFPPSCTECRTSGHAAALIDWELERDSRISIAAISAYDDIVIGFAFLQILGYDELLIEESDRLALRWGPRYRRYLYEGDQHTVLGADSTVDAATVVGESLAAVLGDFDADEVDDISPMEWLGWMVDDDARYVDVLERDHAATE